MSDKKTYYVTSVVHASSATKTIEIEAGSEDEALKLAESGKGTTVNASVELSPLGHFEIDHEYKPEPVYTSELPTEPGYYWFRFDGLNSAIITIYNQEDGSLIAMAAGFSIGVTLKTLVEEGGQFGPRIPMPEGK